MTEELAQLGTDDLLVGEQSSADLAKLIAEQSVEPEPQDSDVTEETVTGEETEQATETADELIEEETESAVDVSQSELQALRQDKERLYDLLQRVQGQPEREKQAKPQLTKEELIEQFTDDPTGFIQQQIRPYQDMLSKVEQQSILDSTRIANPDFARLESVVNKIDQAYPSLDKLDARKRLEVKYLIAKGIEAQQREQDKQRAESNATKKRLKAKTDAAAIPSAKRVAPKEKGVKRPEDMTTAELEKQIRALTG